MLGRLSLRSRLVLGVIALATVGLGVANLATYASLRSFLIDQTDRALSESHSAVEREVVEHGCGHDDHGSLRGASPGDYIELRNSAGEVVCGRQITEGSESLAALSDALNGPVSNLAYGEDFTESAEASGLSYERLLEGILALGRRWEPARTG